MKITGKESEFLEPIPYGIIGIKGIIGTFLKKKISGLLKKKKGITGLGGSPKVWGLWKNVNSGNKLEERGKTPVLKELQYQMWYPGD